MTKAFISEILAVQAHPRVPEMTKKPEILQFFPIFDPPKKIFRKFFCFIFLNFLLRVFCHKIYSNRFSCLEDTKNDQKNTLTTRDLYKIDTSPFQIW